MVIEDSVTRINRKQGCTYGALSSPSQDDIEPRSGAPAYGFPSHRNSTGSDRVGANYGPNSLSRNAGRASVDRGNARSRVSDNGSSGRERFAAPPARGVSRDEQYGRRSQHKPAEVHVRPSKYSNSGEGVPAKVQVKVHDILSTNY